MRKTKCTDVLSEMCKTKCTNGLNYRQHSMHTKHSLLSNATSCSTIATEFQQILNLKVFIPNKIKIIIVCIQPWWMLNHNHVEGYILLDVKLAPSGWTHYHQAVRFQPIQQAVRFQPIQQDVRFQPIHLFQHLQQLQVYSSHYHVPPLTSLQ